MLASVVLTLLVGWCFCLLGHRVMLTFAEMKGKERSKQCWGFKNTWTEKDLLPASNPARH